MSLSTLAALGALSAVPLASPQSSGLSPVPLQASASTLAAFDLAAGQVQSLTLPSAASPFAVDVVLDGTVERLELAPHSMRGKNFQVLTPGLGGVLVPTSVAAPTTVRGTVAGRSQAWVAGSLVDGRLEALVSLGDGRSFGIQPVAESVQPVGAQPHIVYEADDVVPPPGFCATEDGPHEHASAQGGGAVQSGLGNFLVCEIACDADFEFYNKNGQSVDATIADIEKILIGVEAIYGFETEILYEIGTIIVRTSEPDPYTSTSPSTLLQQFDSHWSSQQSGVQRDIAHLFTGKNLDGSVIGIARLNAICSQTNGYGLSQSKYTNSLILRTRLTAHELGHNWSAQHCNGQGDCGIMCQGGCGSPTAFGATSTNSIEQEKASSGCLSLLTAGPVLTGVSGDAVVWMPEPIEVQGTDLFTATGMTLDGVPVLDFDVIDDLTIEFTPPLPTALGDVDVTVTTPLGTSNPVTVTFTDTDPPQLDAPGNPGSGSIATFGLGGEANAAALMVFGFANTTIPVEGVDLLFPDALLSAGSLDNIGLGQFSVELPPLPIFTLIYSQLVTVQGSTIKVSEVQASIIFI